MNQTKIEISDEKVGQVSEVMRALAHPLRLKIIQFIDKEKTTNVNNIYNTLNLEQSITSQHLRILRAADVVIYRREGKFIFYSVNYDKMHDVMRKVEDFLIE